MVHEESFKSPAFDRVVGLPAKNRDAKVLRAYIDSIVTAEGEPITDLEVEKTEKDRQILRFVEQAVSDVLARYGRRKDIAVSERNVHVLKPGGVGVFTGGRFAAGAHSLKRQGVVIDRDPSDVAFALIAFHEMMHLKSYAAVQLTEEDQSGYQDIEGYRSGLSVISRDGARTFFEAYEEAVILLLERRFYEEYIKKNPLFQTELNSDHLPAPLLYREQEEDDLNRIVDDLWTKNRSEFPDRDDVLAIFIDAHVNGRLLALGRLIEKTYGKGSFRKMGEGELKV